MFKVFVSAHRFIFLHEKSEFILSTKNTKITKNNKMKYFPFFVFFVEEKNFREKTVHFLTAYAAAKRDEKSRKNRRSVKFFLSTTGKDRLFRVYFKR